MPRDDEGAAEVRYALRFWQKQLVVFPVFHLFWLPIVVILLWGLTNVRIALGWSAGALAYAGWILAKGWTPWQWGLYVRMRRNPPDDELSPSAFRSAVYRFLHSRRNRLIGAGITATAAITPWIFLLISKAFHSSPDAHRLGAWPAWMFAVLGFVDATGRFMMAMMFWIDATFARWDELVREAGSSAELIRRR